VAEVGAEAAGFEDADFEEDEDDDALDVDDVADDAFVFSRFFNSLSASSYAFVSSGRIMFLPVP